MTPEDIIRYLMDGMDIDILDTIPTQYSDNKKHRADSQPCAIVIISCFNNGFNISEYQYTNISIYPNTKYQYIQT